MAITKVGDMDLDQTAWNLACDFALRPQLYYDKVATVKPTMQAMNGSVVSFELIDDLSSASASLNESTDVTPATMGDTQVTVTLREFGAAIQTTALMRGTAFIPVNPIVANLLGYNAGLSIDDRCKDLLKAGDNVRYAGQAVGRTTVIPTDKLVAANVRRARAELVGANVVPFGTMYRAFIHPDVAYDFRGETGAASWRDPHTYSDPRSIWSGDMGAFEGFDFIETPRAPVFADAGSSTTLTDVYATLFTGQQCFAKAHSLSDGNGPYPSVVPGPVIDILRRFVPMGWYWLGDYAVYRQAALRRVESASSIGTNS